MINSSANGFDLQSIKTDADKNPQYYVLKDEGLETAIQMAIWLGKPLLLTGAPGTGKTQLAYKVADMLSKATSSNGQNIPAFLPEPFVFNTKTTSTATDLFYYYDAVRHFQKRYVDEREDIKQQTVILKKTVTAESAPSSTIAIASSTETGLSTAHPFVKLNALGLAILQAYGGDAIFQNSELNDLQYLANFDKLQKTACSSVVLIDEIDKAPRDFPNDLLYEIENLNFYIGELMNKHIEKPKSGAQIVVIMTSNFEKNLPDAFLRRCLFYHIPSPKTDELIHIVHTRIEPHLTELYKEKNISRYNMLMAHLNKNIEAVVNEFETIKTKIKDKQPATSELLEWVKGLEKLGFFETEIDFKNPGENRKKTLINSLSILTKSKDDIESLKKHYSSLE